MQMQRFNAGPPTKQRYIRMSTTNVQYTNFWTSTSTQRLAGTNYYATIE